jgi:hypothetical protein
MLIKPCLPGKLRKPSPTNPFSTDRFKLSDHGSQRLRWQRALRRDVPVGRLLVISGQHHDPVNMIRHHHKLVQANVGSHSRGPLPFFLHDQSSWGQVHRSVNNFSQHTLSFLRTDSDQIPTRLRIIPPGKAKGLTPISMVQECPLDLVIHRPS